MKYLPNNLEDIELCLNNNCLGNDNGNIMKYFRDGIIK